MTTPNSCGIHRHDTPKVPLSAESGVGRAVRKKAHEIANRNEAQGTPNGELLDDGQRDLQAMGHGPIAPGSTRGHGLTL